MKRPRMRDVARALETELRAAWSDPDVTVTADDPQFDPPSARIVVKRLGWQYERRLTVRELDAGAELLASAIADECEAVWTDALTYGGD